MARNLAQLRADVRGLAGLSKATPAEVDALIDEAHKALCVRSEWTRAEVELGPTVEDQAAYSLPDSVYRILKLKVHGSPYLPSDDETVERVKDGELRVVGRGLWYLTQDADGAETVKLYPVPGPEDAMEITASSVVYPADLVDGADEVRVPDDFVLGIREYVKMELYSDTEDDDDRLAVHEQRFENVVTRLRQHRISRAAHGNVHMAIEGMTA